MLLSARSSRLVFFTAFLLFNGCVPLLVGGSAGGSAYAYVAGEMQVTEPANIDQLWLATQRALDDLELQTHTKDKDALTAKLIARGAEGKKITVRLERASDEATIVRIRVGTFGDERFSTLILEKIERRIESNQKF